MKKIFVFLCTFVLIILGCYEPSSLQVAEHEGCVFYVKDLGEWDSIKDKSIDEIVDSVSSISGRSCSNFSSVSSGISDDIYISLYEETMKSYPDIYRLNDDDLDILFKIFPDVNSVNDVQDRFDIIENIVTKMITYDFCKRQSEMRFSSRGYSSFISDKQRDLMNRNVKYIGGTLTGSSIAVSETNSNYKGKKTWQTKADAFRHGCWHAFIVYSTGYVCKTVDEAINWADQFIDAHEDGDKSNIDTVMDLHNNAFSSNYTRSVAYKKGVSVKMPKRREIVAYVKNHADSAIFASTINQIENADSRKLVYLKEF